MALNDFRIKGFDMPHWLDSLEKPTSAYLILLIQRNSESRWNRVIRRWEAKHKPTLVIENSLMAVFSAYPGVAIEPQCPTCEGAGVVPEEHDFCTEFLGCPDCMGSGKA
jgi:hypothetical protein